MRKALGINFDIRVNYREAIYAHPMTARIELIEGSSADRQIVALAKAVADCFEWMRVWLDSNCTGDHELAEVEDCVPMVAPVGFLKRIR